MRMKNLCEFVKNGPFDKSMQFYLCVLAHYALQRMVR